MWYSLIHNENDFKQSPTLASFWQDIWHHNINWLYTTDYLSTQLYGQSKATLCNISHNTSHNGFMRECAHLFSDLTLPRAGHLQLVSMAIWIDYERPNWGLETFSISDMFGSLFYFSRDVPQCGFKPTPVMLHNVTTRLYLRIPLLKSYLYSIVNTKVATHSYTHFSS